MATAARARALWFRFDLRLDDHPALLAACEGAVSLVPIYVLDPSRLNVPTLAGAQKCSARRCRFILESVANLRRSLEAKGSGLAVGVGKPSDVISKLSGSAEAVFVTQGVCSEETGDEAQMQKRLGSVPLKREWGNTLFLPQECGQDPRNVPLMFTTFKNKAESRGRIRDPVPAPKQLPPLPEMDKEALAFMPSLVELGYSEAEAEAAMEDDPRSVLRFQGGEEAANARLQKWMFDDDRLKDYFDIRNGMKGEAYSSKFSPWLALGCISPRRIWKEAQRYERERNIKNKSTYWLIFELTWRDFYLYVGLSQGDKIFHRGGVIGDRMPWKGGRDALQRWKDGRTGDLLVDANMRELAATGFMSNRGRQNVASYLIFNLEVDWRYGAAHFEEHLLDHDPCSNWGNWVAAAGLTGQRINKFNTKKQLSDYDPRREYVNHWLNGKDPASEKPVRNVSLSGHKGKGKGKSSGKHKGSSSMKETEAKRTRRWQAHRVDDTVAGA